MMLAVVLRLLLLWLALALLIGIWRGLRRHLRRPPPHNHHAARVLTPQPMVACTYCAVLLPRGEALVRGERFYCCREHEKAHKNK